MTGDGFSVQSNMAATDEVWPAMAAAYGEAKGDLAERLLAALDGAEAVGGDIRGRQSAALLVVSSERDSFPLVDLRVDHHAHPLAELRRILRLHRAYTAEYQVSERVANGDLVSAAALLDVIASDAPEEAYLQFLRAYHLIGRLGRHEEGVASLRKLVQTQPIWIEYLRRDALSDTFDAPGLATRLLQELGAE